VSWELSTSWLCVMSHLSELWCLYLAFWIFWYRILLLRHGWQETLTVLTKLVSVIVVFSSFFLPSSGVTGLCHHTLIFSILYKDLIYVFLFLVGGGFPLRSYITYFCVARTTIPNSSILREEGVFFCFFFFLMQGTRYFSLSQEKAWQQTSMAIAFHVVADQESKND
jgi:hypothetical protein